MGESIVFVSLLALITLIGIISISFYCNKQYNLSIGITSMIFVLYYVVVLLTIVSLYFIQPDYTCSINGNIGNYDLTLDLNTKIPKQIVADLPWNCWKSDLSFSQELPEGIEIYNRDIDDSTPYFGGRVTKMFPTTTVDVSLTCVDVALFKCGSVTFKTCSSRSNKDDCLANQCTWNVEGDTCM